MNDQPQAGPQALGWQWLGTLTLVLWAALGLCVALFVAGYAVAGNWQDSYSIYMPLFGLGTFLSLILLPAAIISALLHLGAFVAHRIGARMSVAGITSSIIVVAGDLMIIVSWAVRLN